MCVYRIYTYINARRFPLRSERNWSLDNRNQNISNLKIKLQNTLANYFIVDVIVLMLYNTNMVGY